MQEFKYVVITNNFKEQLYFWTIFKFVHVELIEVNMMKKIIILMTLKTDHMSTILVNIIKYRLQMEYKDLPF